MTDKKAARGVEEGWDGASLEEAFRPFIELEQDTSPQGRKKLRILRAATELFEKQGFRKTSIDEIARRAEVAKGTVYLYYESKAKLLVQAIGLQKKALWKSLEPLFTGEIPERERLHRYMRVVLTSAREVPLASRLMRGDGELAAVLEEVGDDPQYKENQARGEAWLCDMLERAAPGRFTEAEKRARASALISVSFLTVVLLEQHTRFGWSYDEVASTLADIIVYGAVNRPPEPE
jgi:AcrR family transcriptional regulator